MIVGQQFSSRNSAVWQESNSPDHHTALSQLRVFFLFSSFVLSRVMDGWTDSGNRVQTGDAEGVDSTHPSCHTDSLYAVWNSSSWALIRLRLPAPGAPTGCGCLNKRGLGRFQLFIVTLSQSLAEVRYHKTEEVFTPRSLTNEALSRPLEHTQFVQFIVRWRWR